MLNHRLGGLFHKQFDVICLFSVHALVPTILTKMGSQHYSVCSVVPNIMGMLMSFGLNFVKGHSKHVCQGTRIAIVMERMIDSHAVIHYDTVHGCTWCGYTVLQKSFARSWFNDTSIQCVCLVHDDPSYSCLCVEVWRQNWYFMSTNTCQITNNITDSIPSCVVNTHWERPLWDVQLESVLGFETPQYMNLLTWHHFLSVNTVTPNQICQRGTRNLVKNWTSCPDSGFSFVTQRHVMGFTPWRLQKPKIVGRTVNMDMSTSGQTYLACPATAGFERHACFDETVFRVLFLVTLCSGGQDDGSQLCKLKPLQIVEKKSVQPHWGKNKSKVHPGI